MPNSWEGRSGHMHMGDPGFLAIFQAETGIFIAVLCIGVQSGIWFRKGVAALKDSLKVISPIVHNSGP